MECVPTDKELVVNVAPYFTENPKKREIVPLPITTPLSRNVMVPLLTGEIVALKVTDSPTLEFRLDEDKEIVGVAFVTT